MVEDKVLSRVDVLEALSLMDVKGEYGKDDIVGATSRFELEARRLVVVVISLRCVDVSVTGQIVVEIGMTCVTTGMDRAGQLVTSGAQPMTVKC